MPRSLSSSAREHETLAAAFVDAVRECEEGFDLGNAAGHRVGEKHIRAARHELVDARHDLERGSGEAAHAGVAAAFDGGPVEHVFLPVFERHAGQHVGRVRLAGGRVEVEAGHHRHVDDGAAELFFGFRVLFHGQRAQRVVVVAAADGDADDGHAGGARLVDEAVDIAATEQLAEQDEHIAFAEQFGVGDVAQEVNSVIRAPLISRLDWASRRRWSARPLVVFLVQAAHYSAGQRLQLARALAGGDWRA